MPLLVPAGTVTEANSPVSKVPLRLKSTQPARVAALPLPFVTVTVMAYDVAQFVRGVRATGPSSSSVPCVSSPSALEEYWAADSLSGPVVPIFKVEVIT